jgi:hypothetical protein
LLLFYSIICSAQDIKIEGIISFDIKGNKYVSVQVNDTLKKFRDKAKLTKKWDGYPELKQRYVTHIPILQVFLVFQPNHQIHYSLHCLTLHKICSIWFNKKERNKYSIATRTLYSIC